MSEDLQNEYKYKICNPKIIRLRYVAIFLYQFKIWISRLYNFKCLSFMSYADSNIFVGWQTRRFQASKCYIGKYEGFYRINAALHKKTREHQCYEGIWSCVKCC